MAPKQERDHIKSLVKNKLVVRRSFQAAYVSPIKAQGRAGPPRATGSTKIWPYFRITVLLAVADEYAAFPPTPRPDLTT